MIDMHTHTWYSDGNLSPTQLLEMAAQKGIDTVAITDHDGTFGLKEGAEAAERLGIKFINGIEFSAYIPEFSELGNVYMHILGYGFDPEDRDLMEKVIHIRQKRRERNARMLETFEEMGFPLTREDLEVYPGQDYLGKPNFARALMIHGYASSMAEAFTSEAFMASPKIRAIHREKTEAAEAIALIRGAGGTAVLAHPYQVFYEGKGQDSPEVYFHKLTAVVKDLCRLGLSGMECYYSSHSREQALRLSELAEELGLAMTAGSDYHGPGMKKNVELGGVHGG